MKVEIEYKSVLKVIGWLMIALSLMMLIPLVVEICVGGNEWPGFVSAISGSILAGGILSYKLRFHRLLIGRREGFMLVNLVWILYSAFGMIPFMMSSQHLVISDAFFETMSGFTTTGATTIEDVESLGKGVLLWRSMTQWIGGLGIILFILAILPALNENGGVPMFNAETSGITHEKLHPRIRNTAATLWTVYIGLTSILILLLWAGPMNFYDSVCHAFTTIATGGFSTRNAGIEYWNSDYVYTVLTIFMFLGWVNFALIYLFCKGRFSRLLKNDVFTAYLTTIAVCCVAISLSLLSDGKTPGISDNLVKPLFHVVSAITSTGFGLSDFASWGSLCLLITFLLMFSGGCAGSTSGAIKVDRLVATRHNLLNQIKSSLYPNRVYTVRVNDGIIAHRGLDRLHAFILIYLALVIAGTAVLTAYGMNLVDSTFAVVSCIGNNGLGYGETAVSGGFHYLADIPKWVLSFLMLAGRLELFSVLVFFVSAFWRK